MTYSLPDNHFRSLTSCTDNMTAAIKNEIQTLSVLLRGLCLKKSCTGVVNLRCRNVSTACVKHNIKFVPPVKAVSAFASASPFQRNVVCTGTGTHVQQQRTYAKAPPPQKKKLSFDYSGDLMTQQVLNPQELHADFRSFSELDGASELIQKLCSIDFASGGEKKIHRKEEMKERILKLFGNTADREMHVAMLTVDIRNMIPHVLQKRKDKLSKSRLIEKIQLRKKILKYLRRTDYQRFLWLLQELRIRYVLPPEYYRRITRKYRRKQEVWEAANNLRLKKIADLRQQLEEEKAQFLKHKEETLRQIELDAQRYDLDLAAFEKKLERQRVGKTYPRIYTWEEKQQMEKELAMK